MTAGWDWGVPLLYAGLCAALAGAVGLATGARARAARTRRTGSALLTAGALLLIAGLFLPAREIAPAAERSRLDDVVPVCQFREFHSVRIRASPSAVFQAVRAVTARDIRFFRALTWIRSPRLSRGRESILAAPPDQPILDVALRSGFLLLDEVPDREIVFGTILCGRSPGLAAPGARAFADFSRPGFCKAAMNFRIAEEGNGFARLTTETRVLAYGASARRRFAVYWRMIYPGSALIRQMWLQAIRRRAEEPRAACSGWLVPFLRPVDDALARFEAEADEQRGPRRAEEVLAQARLVREELEASTAEPVCVAFRREELIFLNHLILGFQAYVAGGPRDQGARAALDAIVVRARAHERRGLPPP